MVDLKQTLRTVKSKTTVDVKYSRKEHSARVSSLLRVYEQYERQLEGQARRQYIWQYISHNTFDGLAQYPKHTDSLFCTVAIRSTTLSPNSACQAAFTAFFDHFDCQPFASNQVKELERLKEVEAAVHLQTMEFLDKKKNQLQDEVDVWEERRVQYSCDGCV